MEQIYAVLSVDQSRVENIVVGDAKVIQGFALPAIRIDQLSPRPGIGWGYDPVTQEFSAPI